VTGVLLAAALGCNRTPPAPTGPGQEQGPQKPTPALNVPRGAAPADKPTPPPPNPSLTVNDQTGVLSGVVRWQGEPDPTAAKFPGTPTLRVDGRSVPARPTPRLAVNPDNGGVAGVVVWLVGVPAAPAAAPEMIELCQQQGDYRPHVQAARRGVRLRLTCADDQADFRATGAAVFSQPVRRGEEPVVPLSRAGLVEIASDLHPWLLAHVQVLDHPFFAVTDADGRFRLPAAPPGVYKVVLWHPGWRWSDADRFVPAPPVQRQVEVKLGDRQGTAIDWKLSRADADTR
jgi:hypothetical protein